MTGSPPALRRMTVMPRSLARCRHVPTRGRRWREMGSLVVIVGGTKHALQQKRQRRIHVRTA